MSQCKDFEYWILTGYIDGEIDRPTKDKVERHLSECPACRALLAEAKADLVTPFQKVSKEPVPDEIWTFVREHIGKQPGWREAFAGFVTRVIEEWASPVRLAPAFGMVVVMIAAGAFLSYNLQVREAKKQERTEYLVALFSNPEAGSTTSTESAGPIEEYFL